MKTIAIVAVSVMLSASAWADEASNELANDPANITEPIVLSEAEMDRVTAGGDGCGTNVVCHGIAHFVVFVTWPVEYVTSWLPD